MRNQNTAEKHQSNDIDTQSDRRHLLRAGVCCNCAHQDECGILAVATTPIIQCELYQCCSLAKPEPVGKERSAPEVEREPDGVHLLGLCANCDNRQCCKLPKLSSGVWHCEEYC